MKQRRGFVAGSDTEMSAQSIEQAVAGAAAAVDVTRKTTLHMRGQVLLRIAADLETALPWLPARLAEASGFLTAADMTLEVQRAAEVFRLAAAFTLTGWTQSLDLDASERGQGAFGFVRREPIGAVLGITAFNGPLLIAAHKLAPAIAAGTAIVLKPGPGTLFATSHLAGLAVAAGWPCAAVAALDVDNDATMALVRDPRLPVISFTGGAFGWKIKEAVPCKHVQLELGGVGAVLVAEDADLETAADECAAGGFVRSGQSCISVQRIYVARAVCERFASALAARVHARFTEPPIGPLVNEAACANVRALVDDALAGGARLLCGGSQRGAFFEPTVLVGATQGMRVMHEEAFGPVIGVAPFDSIDQAIAQINAVPGAIHHGIYTSNLDLAMDAADAIRSGGVVVNGPCTWRVDHMPYGGTGRSGFGREGIASAVLEFTEPKVIVIRPSRRA